MSRGIKASTLGVLVSPCSVGVPLLRAKTLEPDVRTGARELAKLLCIQRPARGRCHLI